VTAIPWDAAHDKLSTAIAADEVPDVSLIGTTWMGEFAATGALDPTPDVVDPTSFFDGAWARPSSATCPTACPGMSRRASCT